MRLSIYAAAAITFVGFGAMPPSVFAQSPPYECVNESIDIDIDPQDMQSALAEFSKQTRCPISQDADISGLRSNGVHGTYTPIVGLSTLVEGQGLDAEAIRQGLSVMRAESEDNTAGSDPVYDCQNQSQKVDFNAMRLDKALDELSRQTRCPISLDFEVGGLRSRSVNGIMTPLVALRAMLEGTGLHGRQVKQGLGVDPAE